MAFNQFKYQNNYNKEHYARLSIQVGIEEKEKIDTHWKNKGYKSFNAYVNELIRKDMNEDTSKSINVGDVTQSGNGNSINIG